MQSQGRLSVGGLSTVEAGVLKVCFVLAAPTCDPNPNPKRSPFLLFRFFVHIIPLVVAVFRLCSLVRNKQCVTALQNENFADVFRPIVRRLSLSLALCLSVRLSLFLSLSLGSLHEHPTDVAMCLLFSVLSCFFPLFFQEQGVLE
ncbi:unnamed protein product, partial [Ectocarpus sp. 6 AP-2014]